MPSSNIGVYLIRNKVNGMCYVGSSIDLAGRIAEQRRAWDSASYVMRTIKQDGVENFDFEVLYESTSDGSELPEVELELILQYDSIKNGYNRRTDTSRTRHAPEIIAKRVATFRKTIKTPEAAARRSAASIAIHTPEVRAFKSTLARNEHWSTEGPLAKAIRGSTWIVRLSDAKLKRLPAGEPMPEGWVPSNGPGGGRKKKVT